MLITRLNGWGSLVEVLAIFDGESWICAECDSKCFIAHAVFFSDYRFVHDI